MFFFSCLCSVDYMWMLRLTMTFCKNANIRAQDSPVFRLATRLSPSRTQCNILALLALGFKVIDISIRNRVFTGDRYTSARQKKNTMLYGNLHHSFPKVRTCRKNP
jgi:hypothetical protein